MIDQWAGAQVFSDGSLRWRARPDWTPGVVTPHELPVEFVLRDLRSADLDDHASIIALVADHGPLNRRYESLVRSSEDLHAGRQWQAAEDPHAEWNLVYDIQAYLLMARWMSNLWIGYSTGSPLPEWPSQIRRLHGEPWGDFSIAMNLGLDAYRVRVEYRIPELVGQDRGVPRVDLYSAMCLQLFNIMVEDLPVRTCANETCGNNFVRQIGRSKYGLGKTEGVRFCSASCARAQAQRDYRRRNR